MTQEGSLKVILLGNTSTGKTCIFDRLITGKFDSFSVNTVQPSNKELILEKDGKSYKCLLWDTAGQERYHSLTSMFTQGTNIAILIYSIDNRASFDGLASWCNLLMENSPNARVILVANKKDITEGELLTTDEGKNYANDKQFMFLEVSAKTGDGIDDIKEAIALLAEQCESDIIPLQPEPKEDKKKKCC